MHLVGLQARSIQSYLFASPALRHMIGGSEIVERLFQDFLREALMQMGDHGRVYESAAGKAKVGFDSAESARQFVQSWPILAEVYAPGLITDVVLVSEADPVLASRKVEDELRNRKGLVRLPCAEFSPLVERARHTGNAAVGRIELSGSNRVLADAQVQRQDAVFRQGWNDERLSATLETPPAKKWPRDLQDIVGREESQYLAVIHADGNGLGKALDAINKTESSVGPLERQKEVSDAISRATCRAVSVAAHEVLYPAAEKREFIPARPLVLGGDDLTILVRGDLAIRFTEAFLKSFEIASREELKPFESQKSNEELGLTACAGIAFVKASFPFAQSYMLAESLCAWSKLAVRKIDVERKKPFGGKRDDEKLSLGASCLAFHRLTASLATDFEDDIVPRELTGKDGVLMTCSPYGVGSRSQGLKSLKSIEEFGESLKRRPRGSRRQLLNAVQRGDVSHAWRRFLELAPRDEAKRLSSQYEELCKTCQDSSPAISPLLDAHTLIVLGGMNDEA